MKFFHIPVLFFDLFDFDYGVNQEFLKNTFITLTDDEMADLTLIGAGFYAGLGIHFASKTITLGTNGKFNIILKKLYPYNYFGTWGTATAVPIHKSFISYDLPLYPDQSNLESNVEHDMSYLYDELEDRIIFAYKQYILSKLNYFQKLYKPKLIPVGGESTLNHNNSVESTDSYAQEQITEWVDMMIAHPLYDMLYNVPDLHDKFEELKKIRQVYLNVGENNV